jgi:hypothetical protein
MRHLKLFPLLSASLTLLVGGCGSGGNSVGLTARTIIFDNPGTQTAGTTLSLSAISVSGVASAALQAKTGTRVQFFEPIVSSYENTRDCEPKRR